MKQAIQKLIDQGLTYRDIAKRSFKVGEVQKHFSISTISRWGKERPAHPEQEEGVEKNMLSEGELAAKAFRLFERGVQPARVVIILRVPSAIVSQLYKEWAGLARKPIFPADLASLIESQVGYPVDSESELRAAIATLVDDHSQLQRFTYNCSECGRIIHASPDMEWKSVVSHGYLLALGWRHKNCRYSN